MITETKIDNITFHFHLQIGIFDHEYELWKLCKHFVWPSFTVTVLAMDNNSSQLKAPPEIYKYQVLCELGQQM